MCTYHGTEEIFVRVLSLVDVSTSEYGKELSEFIAETSFKVLSKE
jgi:hypothetical protein